MHRTFLKAAGPGSHTAGLLPSAKLSRKGQTFEVSRLKEASVTEALQNREGTVLRRKPVPEAGPDKPKW